MGLAYKALGAASRRLGRPELLAVIDRSARQAERETIGIRAALASTLDAGGVYVDVGTNRGQVLREAVRVAPGARHIAFEPIPSLAAELAAAFPQVDCRALALGRSPGSARFCHFTSLDGWSGLRRSPRVSDEQGRPEYIDVTVTTIDEQLADVNPTVLKIDVEGAELDALEGGRTVLERARPLLIVEHVAEAAALYGVGPGAMWDLLGEIGYTVFSAAGDGPFSRGQFIAASDVVNWLAVAGSA